jgi:hypothetical protein
MMKMHNDIYGVDFSGAKNAGKKIWIAHGLIQGAELHIEGCRRAEELTGSSRRRDECLAALHGFIEDHGDAVFGLDFPFGLPASLIDQDDWESFILAFPDHYQCADGFRQACREAADGKELKRLTDEESKAPFAAYNIRLYRQTYYGIRDLLHPLVRERAAAVLPMQEPLPDRPWLLEICPASTLKDKGLYESSYKGRQEEKREARVRIVEALEDRGALNLEATTRANLIEDAGGDALDSVVAAVAVSEAARAPRFPAMVQGEPYDLEGYVYV